MSFNQFETEHRRLHILALLFAAPAYLLNEIELKHNLKQIGYPASTDSLRADLAWLNEQGLAFVEHPGAVWTATLTARGSDVKDGLTTVPGVARPEPGALGS